MAKKQPLIFLSTIPSIYRWVDSEVLGIPSRVTSEFLKSSREKYLLTLEGKYEEEYVLEAPTTDERVCYINLHGGSRWMWMYDVLISKFGVCPLHSFPIQHFGVYWCCIIPTSFYSWAMIRGFMIICEYLGVPASLNVFFYLFTLTQWQRLDHVLAIFPSLTKPEDIYIA